MRKILEIYEKYGGNFHHANAYSLLGLIYLKENDLQRKDSEESELWLNTTSSIWNARPELDT